MLGKQHDLAGQTIEDSHWTSQTQLNPLKNFVAKLEDQRKLKPNVFNQEADGSLDTKEIEKMEYKYYLTLLDFIACCDRDPEFVNQFCYWYRWGDFYDFRIVPFEKLKLGKDKSQREKYMTVSASGIVHFNVNNEATFLTIPEWEREKILYTKLNGIRFFRQYFIWKSFSVWKNLMRNNQISHTSETLSRELLILDKELSQPLLNICTSTLMIAEMDIVKMTSDFHEILNNLFQNKESIDEFLNNELNKNWNGIKDKLIDSWEKSMKTFKEDNRISLNNKVEADDDEAEPFLVGDETHKQTLYTQEATTRTHYARLVKYVRLIDYMLMDSKLSLINNSVSHALEIVREDFSSDRKNYFEKQNSIVTFIRNRMIICKRAILYSINVWPSWCYKECCFRRNSICMHKWAILTFAWIY